MADGAEKPGNVLVGFLLCKGILNSEGCKLITVAMYLVATVTQMIVYRIRNILTWTLLTVLGWFIRRFWTHAILHDRHVGFILDVNSSTTIAGTTFSDKLTSTLSS